MIDTITVGILALQGAFREHIDLFNQASHDEQLNKDINWNFREVRTPAELALCDALVIPGGESTTIALVAERSGLLNPLREFVKAKRKPTWGTCAGLILLAESANRTKEGGQELIGGLDVRVNRNHFGRQTESFVADLSLPFLVSDGQPHAPPFSGVFIRAPVVEKVLPSVTGQQLKEAKRDDTVVAPSRSPEDITAARLLNQPVEIVGTLPERHERLKKLLGQDVDVDKEAGDIIAVKQGNVFGTSFHPELTKDARIHVWWLRTVVAAMEGAQS